MTVERVFDLQNNFQHLFINRFCYMYDSWNIIHKVPIALAYSKSGLPFLSCYYYWRCCLEINLSNETKIVESAQNSRKFWMKKMAKYIFEILDKEYFYHKLKILHPKLGKWMNAKINSMIKDDFQVVFQLSCFVGHIVSSYWLELIKLYFYLVSFLFHKTCFFCQRLSRRQMLRC